MSKIYIVLAGDTFQSIARRVYGNERHASNIAKANPGALEPLTAGTSLAIPSIPGRAESRATQAPSASVNEVAILIGNKRWRYWSELVLTRALDGIDTLEFTTPFEPDLKEFKEIFKPFSYKQLVVTVGGELLFTGTLVGVTPSMTDNSRVISVSGYALPGVLSDCTAPASMFAEGFGEIEYNDQALTEIAATLAEPFGIPVEFAVDAGATFEQVAIKPSDNIFPFLTDLAKQRSLVISNTTTGALLFQQSIKTGAPVAVLRQGESPLISVSPSFSPQEYYSSITGLEAVYTGTEGSQYTVKNPHLQGVVRPMTFESPDVLGGDLASSVAAKMGRMFGNMASYTVSLSTWRDPKGALWSPNSTLILEAPGAMIYSPYEFVVRSVSFARDAKSESATLNLVLPGAFNGEIPESMPWDL